MTDENPLAGTIMAKPMAQDTKHESASTVQIYDTFVQTITATEQRRQQTSTAYMSLLAGVAAALGFFAQIDPAYPVAVLFFLSILWSEKIIYYRDIAMAKWQVCLDLESRLPVAPFTLEREALKKFRGNRRVFRGLSNIERYFPMCVAVTSALYLIYRLVGLLFSIPLTGP
ncbi:MAG: RipA family octameric membrane protein [Shinella sp.]|uniref:RipA family octameric membrane protein n=1 Tax=Shinella sp. TaxID=1870904 RepID=UPI0040358A54